MLHPCFKCPLGIKMKKLIVALAAVAAFTGSASAADLAARPYTKAPMMAPAYNWTGFYVFGGAGGGLWDADTFSRNAVTGTPLSLHQNQGGDGWFGTVGVGYDWQFSGSWVAGIFADGQFGSIKGSFTDPLLGPFGVSGQVKNRTNAAAGVRLGYLVAPNVLSYVNGGYSYGEVSGPTLRDNVRSPSQWLVPWRRRRKLPHYLRLRRSWLVNEERISRC